MTNNDILRRIRYTFDFEDNKMIELFAHSGFVVSRATISNWLKKEDHDEFLDMTDNELAQFLNGLIIEKRGAKDGERPVAENYLSNNMVFRKLKIALNLKDEGILEILALTGRKISKHELSAFFRNPNQEQYRICNDQILRNFLMGMQKRYRDEGEGGRDK